MIAPKFAAGLGVLIALGLALAACDDGDTSEPPDAKPTSVTKAATSEPVRSGEASTLTAAVGVALVEGGSADEPTVEISALGIAAPGIGAWTFNVRYDPAVLSVVDCPSEGTAVCNPEFADGTLRFAGASASGLLGDTVMGTVTFRCESAGTSAIEIDVELLADATLGDPRTIEGVDVTNGEVVCL